VCVGCCCVCGGLCVRYFGNVLFMFMVLFDLDYVGLCLGNC
jgi:hypothetical protein